MKTTNPALLDALADCLEAGDSLPDALAKIALAGRAAAAWSLRVGRSVREGASAAAVLRASGVLEEVEEAWLSAGTEADATPAVLHAVAARRRRHAARARSVLAGLVGPFLVGVVTVLLDPLPAVIRGGPYLWPAARGLALLLLAALAIVFGVPAMLRNAKVGPVALRVSTSFPGSSWLAAQYAEEELTSALAAFSLAGDVSRAGVTTAASILAWSPLAQALSAAGRAPATPSPLPARRPMCGIEALAPRLSLDTSLAIVGGVAQGSLSRRLSERCEALGALLTARLRLLVRVTAYGVVVVFSLVSLGAMIAKGIPGMSMLPGAGQTGDEKQLEELLKQLEAP